MAITLEPRIVLKWLFIIIGFLLFANLVGITFKHFIGHDYVYGLVPLFNFNTEKNIPTLYSSLTLMVSALMLLFIAESNRKLGVSYIPWLGMGIIFIFLSIDEFASLHENLNRPVRETVGASGVLYFAWIIPYIALLFLFLAFYARFLLRLPRKVMLLFLLSGGVFVSGAVGMEMIGGLLADKHGLGGVGLAYSLVTTFEELLEMVGVAIFIYALLIYMTFQFGSVTVALHNSR